MSWKRILTVLALGSLLAPGPAWTAGNAVRETIEKPVQQAIDTRQATQKAEEAWRNEREQRKALLASLEQEQARLAEEAARLREEQAARRERIAAKKRQLAAGEEIADQMAPYLEAVLARLRDRIDADQPFLTGERRRRVENLESLLADPGVTVSEKFRKTVEALMVEAEYGRTIEAYQDTITVEGQPLLATIFRLGRIGLFYQTLDGEESGWWNRETNQFESISGAYDYPLSQGIRIAQQQVAPDLIKLPVPGPERAQ